MGSLTYRYRLCRQWDAAGPRVSWVMLNPSTATQTEDDATIRRVTGFSLRWGFGSVVVVNLFALRSTRPSRLALHPDPVGPANDTSILSAARGADLVVVAWGNHGTTPNPITQAPRHLEVTRLLADLGTHCLGVTASRQPRHPLYLPSATTPIPYPAPA